MRSSRDFHLRGPKRLPASIGGTTGSPGWGLCWKGKRPTAAPRMIERPSGIGRGRDWAAADGYRRSTQAADGYRRSTRKVQVAEAGLIAPALALVVRSLKAPAITVWHACGAIPAS